MVVVAYVARIYRTKNVSGAGDVVGVRRSR